MSSIDPFKYLGLKEATASEADVKSAYARLLKETRPEEDRAGFINLREAFTQARQIAKANDVERAEGTFDAEEYEEASEFDSGWETSDSDSDADGGVTWDYDHDLDWHYQTDTQGQLVIKTLHWMVAEGPEPDKFAQEISEVLLSDPTINGADFRNTIISFIHLRCEADDAVHNLAVWEEYEVTPPKWLTDTVKATLQDSLRLFSSPPSDSWNARQFNMVMGLFQPDESSANTDRIDTKSLFEKEQTETFADDHGSYFDQEDMVWVDMSPVAIARRDIKTITDRGLWDTSKRLEEVFTREELQPIDEFQALDAHMQSVVCDGTGLEEADEIMRRPPWLTKDVTALLESTFGWSRQFGRNPWERERFAWLHGVLARDIELVDHAESFTKQHQYIDASPPPYGPNLVLLLLTQIYKNPIMLLYGYFAARALQILFRLVA